MNLDKYIAGLIEYRKKHPGSGHLDVITSADDEGNGFNRVFYKPSIGVFDGCDFDSDEGKSKDEPNAVCVN